MVATEMELDNQEIIYPLCMYDSDEDQRLPGCLAEEFLVQLSELRVINSSFNAVNYKSDEELNMIYEGSRYSNKVQDTKAEVLHLQYMYDSDEEDQMFPHRLADDSVVQPHELEVIKLSSNAVNYETDEELNKIDEGFSYSNKDLCEVLPERIRSLYENYFHTDDLIYHRICSCLSPVFSDMLPSNMDDGFLEGSCEPYAKKLLLIAQGKFNIFNEKIIVKAFYEAEKAHREQKRVNGEPYLQHCAETAMLLASIGVNSIVVAAGLLHDSLDDSDMCYDYMLEKFGPVVADLVGGVSMLSYLSQLARDNNTASKTDEAARLHALFLYRADTRAIVIKLADRLHNMMTLDALPCPKRQGIAKETLVIFVPLANRLGISSWKVQLEDLCFRHLHSVKHNEISSKLKDLVDHDMITSAMERLEQALKDKAIPYHGLCRRIKSVYSTHLKMLNKNLSMDELHDIHGIRVIVDCKEDCYEALAVVYQLWPEVPGKFKDYIAEPQRNGYQSLHAVVICKGKIPLEVQIRSKEMHLEAEFGFAAHWIYKEAGYNHLSFVLHVVKWARWVVARHCVAMSGDMLSIGYADSIEQDSACPCHSGDCPYSRKPHCAEDGPVFVIIVENDKMSVQEFRANATIMDLLLVFGGHPLKEELRPRLNYEPVIDPSCKLQMGDLVDLTPAIPDQSMTQYREEIHRLIRTNVQKAFGVSVPPRLCLMRQRKADGNY